MTSGKVLIELAERCERATGADRELDLAIDCIARPGEWAPVVHKTLNPGCPLDYFDGEELPRYTASLDAAMSLVRDEWQWTLEPDSAWIRFIDPNDDDGVGEVQSVLTQRGGKCTPLAICAAALKALSNSTGDKE